MSTSGPEQTSVFLEVPRTDWVCSNELAFAIGDRLPVSRGHTLVITRRVTSLLSSIDYCRFRTGTTSGSTLASPADGIAKLGEIEVFTRGR